jgi:hypothetical protein
VEWVRRISMADLDSRFGNEWVRRISMAETSTAGLAMSG